LPTPPFALETNKVNLVPLIGVFIIKLSIYYLFLTISLALIIKFKIALEEKYLMNEFKNYLLYKNKVKV